jgi:hypothetical protein
MQWRRLHDIHTKVLSDNEARCAWVSVQVIRAVRHLIVAASSPSDDAHGADSLAQSQRSSFAAEAAADSVTGTVTLTLSERGRICVSHAGRLAELLQSRFVLSDGDASGCCDVIACMCSLALRLTTSTDSRAGGGWQPLQQSTSEQHALQLVSIAFDMLAVLWVRRQ